MDKTEEFKGVWKTRSLHHSILLLDGIVKFRCIFEGDKSFKARAEDYEMLENVIDYLMDSWKCLIKTN